MNIEKQTREQLFNYTDEAGTETHQVSEADIWKQVGNVLDPEEDGFHEAVAALEAQFGKEHVSIQPTTVDGRTQYLVLISPEAQKTQAEEVRKAGL